MTQTTVSSKDKSVHLGSAKAVVGAVLGGLAAAVPLAIEAIADGAVDVTEGWSILSALLVGAGVVGGGVFAKATSVTIE